MVNLSSQKMGIHEWSYDNDISNDLRYKVPHAPIEKTLKDVKLEVELGFDIKQAFAGSPALPELRRPDRVRHPKCIECDACVDICPMDCITFTANGEESDLRERLTAPSLHPIRTFMSHARSRPAGSWPRTKTSACIAALRRALPHRRLGHAEIPAERAQDGVRMPAIKSVNDFVVKFANVNGSGSASANEMFARSILRMGVPVTSRNIFPPTFRACRPGMKCGSRARAGWAGAAAST
jgi:ferredoxin